MKEKFLSLAIISLTFGGLAPLFTGGEGDIVGLFSYLLVLVIGTLWVIKSTAWKVLTPIATAIVMLYSLPYFTDMVKVTEKTTLIIFAAIFGIIFFISNLMGLITSKETSKSDLIAASLNGLYLLGWTSLLIPKGWQAFTAAAIAIIFMLGSSLISKKSNQTSPVVVYAAMACIMIAAALAFTLDGPVLYSAYVLEVLLIVIVGDYLGKSAQSTGSLSLLQAVPFFLSLSAISSYTYKKEIFNSEFVMFTLLNTALIATGWYLNTRAKSSTAVVRTNVLTGSIYALVLLPIILEKITKSTASVTLVIYSLVAIAAYVFGQNRDRKSFRIFGSWLLGLTLAYLLLVQVWTFSMGQRIFTFLGIGILLISTTYLFKNKKH